MLLRLGLWAFELSDCCVCFVIYRKKQRKRVMMIWGSVCLIRSSFEYDFVLCWSSTFQGWLPYGSSRTCLS
jgi:hypothetical protein